MPGMRYRYRLGRDAEFDEARFELRVAGSVVAMQSKPLELLALLLATPGAVIAKATLLDTLWRDREVVEAVLANAASKLRAALGPANASCLVTVPRQGYRIEGPIERIASGPAPSPAFGFAAGTPVPGRAGHRLVRRLGASPGQETWLAEQPRTGERRVFKFALDAARVEALKRELTISRLLRRALGERADLVRVLDLNFEQAPYWLEADYAGTDLDAWAGEPDPAQPGRTRLQALAQEDRVKLVRRIAEAVAAAHGAGVLHKDLKPANVLVAPRPAAGPAMPDAVDASHAADRADAWQVRLTDFGSGRLLDPAELERLRVTRMGFTLVDADERTSGTPYYIAPELLAGAAASPASDVFALGVMLYQLLAGDLRRPLAPGWERDVADELLREDIAEATDIDPARRLASAASLAARLAELPGRRALREADRAHAELARAQAAAADLARQNAAAEALNRLLREDLIAAANPALQGRADITVADALTGAAARIDTKYAALAPALRGHLHAAMQRALGELSRSQEAAAAGRRAVAAWRDARAEAVGAGGNGPSGANGANGVSTAIHPNGTPSPQAREAEQALQEARLRLALDLVQLSHLSEAADVVAVIDAETPAGGYERVFRARLLFVKSWLTAGEMAFEASLQHLEQAAALVEPMSDEEAPCRGVVLFGLADGLALVGRLPEAERVYRRLLAEHVERLGADHIKARYTQVGLGSVLTRLDRLAEAEAELEPAAAGLGATLGAGHRHTLSAHDLLADIAWRRGEFDVAASRWARVQAGFTDLMGAGSSYTLTVQTKRAQALHRSGDAASAGALLADALTHARGFLAEAAPQTQQIRFALADALADLGRGAEAAALAEGLEPQALATAEPGADWESRLAALTGRLHRAANAAEGERRAS